MALQRPAPERGLQPGVLADLMKRLRAAKLPEELRHSHTLRYVCATQLQRAGATLADARVLLGHASVNTTSKICLPSRPERHPQVVRLRDRGRPTLEQDRDAL